MSHDRLNKAPARVEPRVVRSAQVALLYRFAPIALIFSALTAAVLVFSLRGTVPSAYLTPWALAFGVITLARLGLTIAYRRQSEPAGGVMPWFSGAVVGAGLAGCLWGSAAFFLFETSDPRDQLVVVIALAGIAAGSATTLSPVWPVAVAFMLPTVMPVILVYGAMDGPRADAVVGMTVLFVVGLLVTSFRQSQFIGDNIRLNRERSEREAALRDNEIRYRLIFQNVPLGILSYNSDGMVTECNNELAAIMGSRREDVVGLNLIDDLEDDAVRHAVRDSLISGSGEYDGDYTSVTGGKTTPVRALFKAVSADDGGHTGGVAVIEDFTERRQAAATIEHQANYDALTQLANRRLFLSRLENALEVGRNTGQKAGVVFLDLDYFKRINDSMGHGVGDDLLTSVASRLDDIMRGSDTAARLSGDEFVALIGDLGVDTAQAEAQLDAVAERIIEQLSEPYYIRGAELYVSPSLGVVVLPRGEESAMDVLTYADTAMYRAKSAGRATYRIYRASMQAELDERLALESDLREALASGNVAAHYQIIVNRAGAGVGTESLARWYHSQRGSVSPADFIPIAEETGLVVTLGEQMLRQACLRLATHATDDPLLSRISVNVSPRQFRDPGFAEGVERILDETEVEPSRLILEVTENVLVENLELAAGIMHRLKARGVRFSIDDFGMGYSSLAYLKRLPLDILKIDQHFVRDVTAGGNDAAIVETIIAMAEHLDLTVIAEGVETREQFEWLRERGCRFFQGYLFGRPGSVGVGYAGGGSGSLVSGG